MTLKISHRKNTTPCRSNHRRYPQGERAQYGVLFIAYEKYLRNICYRELNEPESDKKIESIYEIDWNGEFDTVIIGHLRKMSNVLRKDLITEIIDKCIKYSKNLYSFDDLRMYEERLNTLRRNGQKAFYFLLKEEEIINNTFGGLHHISCPVLAVCGTSSRQGKFNLQLELKRRLSDLGYAVGQLGTEPTSFLLGMDSMLPVGYESTVQLQPETIVRYINQELHKMDKNEIIIIGTQSQTLPYGYGNLGFLTFSQHSILTAAEPDAVVLCVNIDDEFEYIARNISYVSSCFFAPVVALCLFPYHKNMEWNINYSNSKKITEDEIMRYKTLAWEQFRLPVFVNGEDDEMNELINCIINFFG